MRDTNFNCRSFCRSLEQYFEKSEYQTKSAEVLSLITPRFVETKEKLYFSDFENEFTINFRDKEYLILLSIYSWYCPEEIGILLRLNLERFSKVPDFYYLKFLLENKGTMLKFLIDTTMFSSRDFWGNICNKKNSKIFYKLYSPKFSSKSKPKKVQRARGYKDKGTLRFKSDIHSFATGTREQQTIEQRRLDLRHTYEFLRGFLE